MEVLDYKQMASLINSVTDRITKELYIANRFGTLEEALNKITNEAGELSFSISGLKKTIEKTKFIKDTLG